MNWWKSNLAPLQKHKIHKHHLSTLSKIWIFLWTTGQWFPINRKIKNDGFLGACKHWKINPSALSRSSPAPPSLGHCHLCSKSIHRMVLRVGKCFPNKRRNCLPRALATAYWMQQYHIPFKIRIGIRSAGETVLTSAHAWVEVDGCPIGESPESIEQLKPLDPCQTEV